VVVIFKHMGRDKSFVVSLYTSNSMGNGWWLI